MTSHLDLGETGDFESQLARQLAVSELPAVPDTIDSGLRHRLNRALIISHWLSFVTAVIPKTLATMFNPFGHLLAESLTGRPRRSAGSAEDS
tara:strand:+ start:112 stop:387 length:276 start_codon:yes stop_codon:yes gene_type:complete